MHPPSPRVVEIIKTYKRAFATEDGQAVLRDLKASYLKQPFDRDPYVAAFNAGAFEVVAQLTSFVEADLDKLRSAPEAEKESS